MLGYPDAELTPFLLGWIEGQGLGGVKIFPRNVASLEQLAAHVDELQAAAQRQPRRIPLLIATDLEGGWIDHVKHEISKTPGNLAIGAAGMPADAYRTGRYLGLELAALGINMNFAPTVDVYSSPDASVIGPRAFSSDPVQTGLLAVAYFRGLQSAGIIATAKHYPGHGAADRDSHLVLPRIDADREQLWDRETGSVPVPDPRGAAGHHERPLGVPGDLRRRCARLAVAGLHERVAARAPGLRRRSWSPTTWR